MSQTTWFKSSALFLTLLTVSCGRSLPRSTNLAGDDVSDQIGSRRIRVDRNYRAVVDTSDSSTDTSTSTTTSTNTGLGWLSSFGTTVPSTVIPSTGVTVSLFAGLAAQYYRWLAGEELQVQPTPDSRLAFFTIERFAGAPASRITAIFAASPLVQSLGGDTTLIGDVAELYAIYFGSAPNAQLLASAISAIKAGKTFQQLSNDFQVAQSKTSANGKAYPLGMYRAYWTYLNRPPRVNDELLPNLRAVLAGARYSEFVATLRNSTEGQALGDNGVNIAALVRLVYGTLANSTWLNSMVASLNEQSINTNTLDIDGRFNSTLQNMGRYLLQARIKDGYNGPLPTGF